MLFKSQLLCEKSQISKSNWLWFTPTDHFTLVYETLLCLFCHNCVKDSAQLPKDLGCLACHTSNVFSGLAMQLLCAPCNWRQTYGQSKPASWDTSFPLVILSFHNQQDDDICPGLSTVGSVWAIQHIQNTHPHTHQHTQSPPWISHPSSPFPSFVNSMWSNMLFC